MDGPLKQASAGAKPQAKNSGGRREHPRRGRGGVAQSFGNRVELRPYRAAPLPDARRVRVCTEPASPLQSPW